METTTRSHPRAVKKKAKKAFKVHTVESLIEHHDSQTKSATVVVRTDSAWKQLITRAAHLKGVSTSDYVRGELRSIANQQLADAERGVLRLSAEGQKELWTALLQPLEVSAGLRRLRDEIRGIFA